MRRGNIEGGAGRLPVLGRVPVRVPAAGLRPLLRGRWLCRLSESRLVWKPKDFSCGTTRILTISGGSISHRQTVEVAAVEALGSAVLKPLSSRWSVFDSATYDRLRVLTTELRRLVSEDCPVQLFTGMGRPMDKLTLARQLMWI